MNQVQFWQERMDAIKKTGASVKDKQLIDYYSNYEMVTRAEVEMAEAIAKVKAKQ